jgi:hypothetical protein
VPNPGAPVRVQAQCPVSASLKQVAPDVVRYPWSDGASIVTGYSAVAQTDVMAARTSVTSGWHLPIVQTNSAWNTYIRITNLYTTGSTDVTVELYPNGNTQGVDGADLVLTKRLGVAETWTIDALESLAVEGWVGFARITANREVAALALRSKPEASMALTNVAVAGDPEWPVKSYVLAAPLLFTAYNGWNTGINLANISSRATSVTVRYYENNGPLVREEVVVIPARGMVYIYTPGNVVQPEFVGSATLTSDAPVIAAIDEVKYETTEGLTYLGSGVPQTDAAIPIAFREDSANGRHDNSGINVANLNPTAEQTVMISLASITGAEILPPFALTIPPGSSNFVYLPFIDGIPAGTVASIRLRSDDPLGFVALSNDVNYTVAGDGSVVFVATGAAGYFHLPAPAVP